MSVRLVADLRALFRELDWVLLPSKRLEMKQDSNRKMGIGRKSTNERTFVVRKFLVIKDIKIGIVFHCVSHATQLITDREVFDRELPVIFIALLSETQISNTLHRACL